MEHLKYLERIEHHWRSRETAASPASTVPAVATSRMSPSIGAPTSQPTTCSARRHRILLMFNTASWEEILLQGGRNPLHDSSPSCNRCTWHEIFSEIQVYTRSTEVFVHICLMAAQVLGMLQMRHLSPSAFSHAAGGQAIRQDNTGPG